MQPHQLTIKSVRARPVVIKLRRPIKIRIATITDWPLVLVDLLTEEGVTGRSYVGPYAAKSMRYLVPMLEDLGEALKGRPVAPVDLYEAARKSLHFVGYEGLSMIAVSGLDMAAWDAVAKAAGQPLCVYLGGTRAPVRAYNSNGLWLHEPEALPEEAIKLRDEGGFSGLKIRQGREHQRDDVKAIEAVRRAVGDRRGVGNAERRHISSPRAIYFKFPERAALHHRHAFGFCQQLGHEVLVVLDLLAGRRGLADRARAGRDRRRTRLPASGR
jgi:mandelate racemase